MTSDLERTFFADELDDTVRALLLAEIGLRQSGRSRFTFNLVTVLLDFDAQNATLEGILAADADVVLPLSVFTHRLRAHD